MKEYWSRFYSKTQWDVETEEESGKPGISYVESEQV
jgi:hypothetical protein